MIATNMINASDISLLVDEVFDVLYDRGYEHISIIGKTSDISQFASNWIANYESEVTGMHYDCDDKYCEMWATPDDECDVEMIAVGGFSDTSILSTRTDGEHIDAYFIFDDVPAKVQFELEKTKKPFYVLGIIDELEIEELPNELKAIEGTPFDDGCDICPICNDKAYVAYYDGTPVEGVDADGLFEAFEDAYTLIKRAEDVLGRVYDIFGDDYSW